MSGMNRVVILAVGFPLAVALACNAPAAAPTVDANAIFTQAAETLSAQLTANVTRVSETPSPSATLTPPPLTPTATPVCDLAQFVSDISVPDGTVFQPGDNFTKTWRFKNAGVCAWNSSYNVIFDHGDAMGGPSVQSLAGNVAPGQSVDISVNLKAPGSDGKYRGYWGLRNGAGVVIPILNGYNGQAFYVDIKVKTPATATFTPTATIHFDFPTFELPDIPLP